MPNQYPVIPGISDDEALPVRPDAGRILECLRVHRAARIPAGIVGIVLAKHDIRFLKRRFRQGMPDKNPVAAGIGYEELVVE